jgi:hypothetical protein
VFNTQGNEKASMITRANPEDWLNTPISPDPLIQGSAPNASDARRTIIRMNGTVPGVLKFSKRSQAPFLLAHRTIR